MNIRLATAGDVEAINAIYNYFVMHSTCTYQLEPSSNEERRAWLESHGARYPAIVMEEGGEVVGWGSLSAFHSRAAWRFTVEDSVYVHPAHHRKGVGKALLGDLMQRAKNLGYREVIAIISADQLASGELHARMGFKDAGVLRGVGFKFDRWLDVKYMQWSANG